MDDPPDTSWLLGNEFARVRLRLDMAGHDPRLEIEDLATGNTVLLDPVMLAQLARISAETVHRAMDPGATDGLPLDVAGSRCS